MEKTENIFDKLRSHNFDDSCCFLCGDDLNDDNRTKEHVIPKWLQRRFNLWDQKIVLLNQTTISYRQLTIPCCSECNNDYLQPLEDKIKEALENGVEEIRSLDKNILFYWLGKIFFGMMYKELFLLYDLKNPDKGKLLNPENIKKYQSHLLFLQGIREAHKFIHFVPYSIYIVKTQKPSKIEEKWDFYDNIVSMYIAIRMGEVGIVASLQDCGTSKNLQESFKEVLPHPLHPIQFREFMARTFYKSLLFNRTPKFISFEINEQVETALNPLKGFDEKPIFDDWDNREYAELLSKFLRIPVKEIRPNSDSLLSYIVDENGEPIHMEVDEN